MRVVCHNVYTFEELSDKAKEKALDACRYYNVDHDWWESTYEDAERIGLKLNGFDIDRASYCKGEFISGAEECAHLIEKEHGDICETHKTAKTYLAIRDAIIKKAPKDANGEYWGESALDEALDEADKNFLKSLLEDYLSTLRAEYEYQTSNEQVKESIEANEYEFKESGEPE